MRLPVLIIFVLFGLSSLREESASSFAQNYAGRFSGSIVDTKGKRIRGASVAVEGVNLTRKVKPNRKGQFEIDLPVGIYRITVKKSGFATYELTNLEVKSGENLSHVFRLEPSNLQSGIFDSTMKIPTSATLARLSLGHLFVIFANT